jgi:hypothetical protein
MKLFTEHIDHLREVFKAVRKRQPSLSNAKGGMRFAFPPYGPVNHHRLSFPGFRKGRRKRGTLKNYRLNGWSSK